MKKITVVIGASPNPERYSYKAMVSLKQKGFPVIGIGLKEGEVEGMKIVTDRPALEDVDTVSLYVGPHNQAAWTDYIISLKPERVIFNPGTENPALQAALKASGIEYLEACTLVLLSIGNF